MTGLVFSALRGEWEQAVQAKAKALARATTSAMHAAADQSKREGRSSIARAGFGTRWQNALRVRVYPERGNALGPAFLVFHKIGYASIFESGGTIRGRPLLWLALPTAPKKIGTRRLTPQLYRREIGPLFLVKRPGRKPLLVAKLKAGRRARGAGRLTVATLRRQSSASAKGVRRSVPIFVGLTEAQIPARFNLRRIVGQVRRRIPALIAANLEGLE